MDELLAKILARVNPQDQLAYPGRHQRAGSLFSFRLTVANRIHEPEQHHTQNGPTVKASAMRLKCTYNWFVICLGQPIGLSRRSGFSRITGETSAALASATIHPNAGVSLTGRLAFYNSWPERQSARDDRKTTRCRPKFLQQEGLVERQS